MSPRGTARLTCVAVSLQVPYGELARRAPGIGSLVAAGERVLLEVGPPGRVDLPLVGALAELVLAARRSPGALVVRTGTELRGLLALTGLLPAVSGSGQAEREAVLLEDLVAEEVVDVGDPPV